MEHLQVMLDEQVSIWSATNAGAPPGPAVMMRVRQISERIEI